MRKKPTPAEDALWQRLRKEQLGVKFRRQHCIDRFIVDFYAREPRLIVEVDGPIHEIQKEYDAWRQDILESLGYSVLRFTNDDVLKNMEQVLAAIQAAIVPSPQGGFEPHPLPPSPQTGKGNAPSSASGRGSGGGVYHAHLYGPRVDKYDWLDTHNLTNTHWQSLSPQPPFYLFVPRQTQNLHPKAYLSWPSINEIFPVNSVGIVTARDKFVIAFDKTELQNRILQFQNVKGLPDDILRQTYDLRDKSNWSLEAARKCVQAETNLQNKIYPILYRPFDVRYIFYHDAVIERPRSKVMRHMLPRKNLALLWTRPMSPNYEFSILCSSWIVDQCVVGNKSAGAGISYLAPLYLYHSTPALGMFQTAKQPNLAEWLLPKLADAYGFTPTPEDVLAYIYAVFYSNIYRQQYAEELRSDFPRVSLTGDPDLFREIAKLGMQLIDLHLLRHPLPPLAGSKGGTPGLGVKYHGQGSDRIEFVRYDSSTGRVAINREKYFEGITPEMWNYKIGGYQVLEKYLKDRKGRYIDDPVRYINIAVAIVRTMVVQTQIDRIYPKIEEGIL